MKRYLYFHIYILVRSYIRFNARESAILYFSAIVNFITLSFVMVIIWKVFGELHKRVFLAICLAYSCGLYFVIKRHFGNVDEMKKIIRQFEKESKLERTIGTALVILQLAVSPIIFFLTLSLF